MAARAMVGQYSKASVATGVREEASCGRKRERRVLLADPARRRRACGEEAGDRPSDGRGG
jgi:hypothetical protein